MSRRAILILVLAVILAGGAVFLTRSWLEQQIQPGPAVTEREPTPTTTIVVADQPLFYGNSLTPEKVREIEWVAGEVPEGAFATEEDLFGEDDDRVVLRTIEKNEMILASKISGEDNAAHLSTTISENMRAITIRVNDVHGVAGFVIPGDHVDVILTRDSRGGAATSALLLQNISVLGIDQQASEDQDDPQVVKAVTLEVTPYQAQKIALASTVGRIDLALRNRGSSDVVLASLVTLEELGIGEAMVSLEASEDGTPEETIVTSKPTNAQTGVPVEVTRGIQVYRYNVSPDDGSVAVTQSTRAPEPEEDGEAAASEESDGEEGSGEPTSLLPKDEAQF